MVRGRILIRPLQNIEAVFVEEMKQNIFLGTLKDTEEDEAFTVYSEYINCLLEGSYWESGSTHNAKILWKSGRKARASNPDEFKCSGLYIWGGESYPVYVGNTGNTFNKRFYRYIWGQHSQCDLAERYERELKNNGIEGFPTEVREWYKKIIQETPVASREQSVLPKKELIRLGFHCCLIQIKTKSTRWK